MHKSKTIQKAKNSQNETVYLTVKTRTGFDSDVVKCVILVKTSKQIIYQSKTCILHSNEYSNQLYTAHHFFLDATEAVQKLVQLKLF